MGLDYAGSRGTLPCFASFCHPRRELTDEEQEISVDGGRRETEPCVLDVYPCYRVSGASVFGRLLSPFPF